MAPQGLPDSEIRRWTELLNARIRKKLTHRPSMAGSMAAIDATESQMAATMGRQSTGIVPESTRL